MWSEAGYEGECSHRKSWVVGEAATSVGHSCTLQVLSSGHNRGSGQLAGGQENKNQTVECQSPGAKVNHE